jgi:hypothetical protein
MRIMLEMRFPIEPFNSMVRDGSAGPTMMKILDDLKPEAAYFGEHDGNRGGWLVIEVKNASDVPRFAEPWFLKFNAELQFRVCMLPQDLGAANLEALGKKWG